MDGSTEGDGDASAAVDSIDRTQLLLVGCCLLAVLVAALLAPPPVEPSVPNTSNDATPTERPPVDGGGGETSGGESSDGRSGGSGGGESSGSVGTSDGSGDVADGTAEPIPIPGDEAPDAEGCGVLLEDRPVPGTTVTVGVFDAADPLSDVAVRFNGDPVGRTDEDGRVSGQVPYNRTLAVTVDVDADCEFYRERFDANDTVESGLGSGVDGASASDRRPESARQSSGPADAFVGAPDVFGAGQAGTAAAQAGRSGNATGAYLVRGDVDLTVQGDPYPGETLTVRASVEGVPMPEATVEVGGESAGQTGPSGGARLTVPEGQQAVALTVSRRDFAGETTVDVLLLTASVRPREGLPVPGERAAVVAAIDERPAEGVQVRLAGQDPGETTSDGTLPFRLPARTGASVVVSSERQTARVPLWQVYLPTVGNLLAVLGLGVVGVVGTRLLVGETATARVAVGWSALAVADAAYVVGEVHGLVLALGVTGLVGLVRYRRRLASGGGEAVGLFVWAASMARRTALEVVNTLERLLDGFLALLRGLYASLTSFETFVAWIDAVVRKVLTTVRVVLTLERVGAALFVGAELALATARWGHEGLIASVGGLSVLALLVVLWRREDVGVESDTDGDGTDESAAAFRRSVTADESDSTERVFSIRELWRRFARWVVPGAWRTKTPGEVARAAVDRGFPREPVEALTDAFRDVEYGSEPATSRRERARAALDRLARRRDDE